MTAKGSKNCCCDACTVFPADAHPEYLDPAARYYVNHIQTHCCQCIPKAVCASLLCAATGEFQQGTFVWGGPDCTQVRTHPEWTYWGSIGIAGRTIDLAFYFQVINGQCYFSLHSSALGVTGTGPYDSYLIDGTQRANGFCQTLLYNGQPLIWDVYDPGCGLMRVELAAYNQYVHTRALTPITRRQPCQQNGITQADTNPIKNLCTGCGCISTEACITVRYSGGVIYAAVARLSGTSWATTRGANDATVEIVADPATGKCALKLVSIAGLPFAATPSLVLISSSDPSHPCPFPQANWLVTIDDGKGGVANVQLSMGTCDACEAVYGSCCNEPIPRALLFSMVSSPSRCACATFSLPLVYDQVNNWWYGESDTLWCGHHVDVTWACGTVAINAPPCILTLITQTSFSCYPFRAAGTGRIAGGIGCCAEALGALIASNFDWTVVPA